MGLLDFFKKKEKIEEKKVEKVEKKVEKKKVKKEAKPLGKKAEEKIKPGVPKPKKKISEKGYKILYPPHVTEKATRLGEENKYVFKVWTKTNKTEIKKVIEGLYGVNVIGIKIINVPRKRRRLGRQMGWKKGYKKAIVKIKKGQKIEILPR